MGDERLHVSMNPFISGRNMYDSDFSEKGLETLSQCCPKVHFLAIKIYGGATRPWSKPAINRNIWQRDERPKRSPSLYLVHVEGRKMKQEFSFADQQTQ